MKQKLLRWLRKKIRVRTFRDVLSWVWRYEHIRARVARFWWEVCRAA